MPKTKIELRRCPFCGKQAEPPVKHFRDGIWYFVHWCDVIGHITLEGSLEWVVSTWNTRAETSVTVRSQHAVEIP
jgi:hypothetical protein